jgi:hypothetical protein
VLIDGGLLGSFKEASAKRARRELADIREGNVFFDLLGLGLPEIAGIFAQLGALYAYERPGETSTVQSFPLLPANVKPAFPVTNEGLLGYAFDETTSPDALALIRIRAGGLAASGDPRPWENGDITPIRRFAKAHADSRAECHRVVLPAPPSARRDAASDLRVNKAAKILGLRLEHGREIDLPLYAFSTDLTQGRVARGARKLARRTPIENPVVIDDRKTSHLDPLSAAPKTNSFLKTVVPFLKKAL